ncbi:MAG: calcium-binding protein, partial [Minwuia sp.]|nr:calcium-binding protein [Minwuia sp.]
MSRDETIIGEIDATFSYASGKNVDARIGKTRVHKADVDSSKVSGLKIEASDDRDPQTLDPDEKISFSFTDERGRLVEVEDASVGRSSSQSGDDDTGTLTAVGETDDGDRIALILSFDAPSIEKGDAFFSRDSDAEKAGSGKESVSISALGEEPAAEEPAFRTPSRDRGNRVGPTEEEPEETEDRKLKGDKKDNAIEGADGDDEIDGEDGDDTLSGGAGDDEIDGDKGDDVIDGGAGDDEIDGDKGDDIIDGGAGDDTIDGGDGDDTITAGAGDDRLDGDKGDDLFLVGEGSGVIDGGKGNDTADFSGVSGAIHDEDAGTVTVGDRVYTLKSIENVVGASTAEEAEAQEDAQVSDPGTDDNLNGDYRNNELDGGAGNDTINGQSGKDTLVGGDGNDSLNGQSQDDTLFGDAGNDVLKGESGA